MKRYAWATSGDVNAFFGLMLDNIADMVLAVSLLVGAFHFDATFAVRYMIPGTALGVLVGDLLFTAMAFRLARQTGRSDVTAMPLGLDTPSTIGMILFVVGPAFLDAQNRGLVPDQAARYAWHLGAGAIVISGVFKLLCALGSAWVRRVVPRAGLLGSLTSIALVLISFLPLLDLAAAPVAGLASLAVILTTLVARLPLPGRMPGALGAVLLGTGLFYLMRWTGLSPVGHEVAAFEPSLGLLIPWPSLAWVSVLPDTLAYLPVVIPFALATVVGGIDCTESAAAVGDEYPTGQVIAVEGLATLIAGLCGGVVQTTPYIGHPAYRAMGGRAAYTLATALFIGGAGMLGYFAYFYLLIPKAAVLPILIFVGLEITSQSFLATPRRHYPAVVLACVPAMAYLVTIFSDNLLAQSGLSLDRLAPPLGQQLQTIRMLSGGFIVTSLVWASALAATIDRRLARAAAFWALAGLFTSCGVMHSPLPGSSMFWPWQSLALPEVATGQSPREVAAAYFLVAALMLAWSRWVPPLSAPQPPGAEE